MLIRAEKRKEAYQVYKKELAAGLTQESFQLWIHEYQRRGIPEAVPEDKHPELNDFFAQERERRRLKRNAKAAEEEVIRAISGIEKKDKKDR